MRHALGFSFVLSMSVALAEVPAPPADPAPPPSLAATYDLDLAGVGKGTEVVKLEEKGGAFRLTSRVEVTTPQGPMILTQDSSLAGTPAEIVRYALTLEPPGEKSKGRMQAARQEGGWHLEASAAAEDPAQKQSKEIPVTGRSVVLDNLLPSQVDVFVRTLDLKPGTETTVAAVVPQALVAAPMKVQRLQDGSGTFEGKPVPLRRYRLNLGNVLMEVEASTEDGALLRARVPIQSVSYVRRGFAIPAEAPAEPADDPRESAVTVPGPAVGLPGVLTMPPSDKPAAAVVLLAGSGPQDRDETVGTNKPLRDLARGLAGHGIASLRYDKRTYVKRDPSVAPDLRREYVEDARAAIAMLRGMKGIDPARIFVAGHSLGGSVAPLVAADGGVRGLLLLAPMARRADEVLLDQIPFQLRLSGAQESEISRRADQIREYFAALADAKADPGFFFGASPAYWRDWLALDVPKLLRESTLPVLVLQGAKDIQVRPEKDFEKLKREVGDGGGRIAYRLFPELNHLFLRTEGPSTGAEYGIPGRMEPSVIKAAAEWIAAH
jgi:dienelactone hydrolase